MTPTLKYSKDITNHRRSEKSNMNAKSFSQLVVMMLVAVMAFRALAVGTDGWWCKTECSLFCFSAPNPELCYRNCMYHCKDKVETPQGQCNFSCLLSKCHDPHPGTHENLTFTFLVQKNLSAFFNKLVL